MDFTWNGLLHRLDIRRDHIPDWLIWFSLLLGLPLMFSVALKYLKSLRLSTTVTELTEKQLTRKRTKAAKAKARVAAKESKALRAAEEAQERSIMRSNAGSYEAFLVLDVEGTCIRGKDMNWPNEIIEWPVCLMRWDMTATGQRRDLRVMDEFRTFVKPTWRPVLSEFCTELTGITQEQVNVAPLFPQVLESFAQFLSKHGLIDQLSGEPLVRFCWCSDGPWDVRDFVVKQCFISGISMPEWLKGDILDTRIAVRNWADKQTPQNRHSKKRAWDTPRTRSLNIPSQLRLLGLTPFEGRQHSGIDDARNIARIVAELARRGVRLAPNTAIDGGRRWEWMGPSGEILEYVLQPAES